MNAKNLQLLSKPDTILGSDGSLVGAHFILLLILEWII